MANECTRDAIQRFLTERGGRVPHADLTHHFRRLFPQEDDDPQLRRALRETFKAHVDALACVRTEDGGGARLVCLKKRYMRLVTSRAPDAGTAGDCADPRVAVGDGTGAPPPVCAEPVAVPAPADLRARSAGDGDGDGDGDAARPSLRAPGSDYGNDDSGGEEEVSASAPPVTQVNIPASPCASSSSSCSPPPPPSESSLSAADARHTHTHGDGDMGHRWSSHGGNRLSIERRCARNEPPTITVIGASPLPLPAAAAAAGDVFVLPVTAPGSASPGAPRRRASGADESQQVRCFKKSLAQSDDEDVFGPDVDVDAGGQVDSTNDSSATPLRSPQALRSLSQRNASFLSARRRDGGGDADSSDYDAASLASSTSNADTDDAHSSVAAASALDPLEHEWMMCASDGAWERLEPLLAAAAAGEPSLVTRRDFVTGFSLLHWAAKRGDPELLALAVSHARRRGGGPVDVNARSACGGGYTPLHLAAMQGHLEVVKLLVGAYDADVEARDYGGRRAGHYLVAKNGAANLDIRDIIGALDDGGGGGGGGEGGEEGGARWSFLRPHLRTPGEGEGEGGGGGGGGGARVKPLRRMSSLGRVKPRLQRLRDRTSQMVHSASFRELGGVRPGRPRSEYVPGSEPEH